MKIGIKKWEILLLIFVLSVGIFFRLYKIDTVPFGTNHDGAWGALWAIELSQKPWPIQVFSDQSWLGEAMPRYVMATFIKLFGPTIFSLRMGMTIFTILALPAFYLLVRSLFNNYLLALFSTFLLSTSGWDIIYAKSGWATSSVPIASILTVYFLLKAIRTQKTIFFILTGLALTLTFNTYRGSSTPLIIGGVFLWYLIRHLNRYKAIVTKYIVFSIFFAITVSPIALYALNHWNNYTARPMSLYVGNRIKAENSLKPLIENIKKAALMYNLHGGGDDFFIKEPLLDFPTNWLFLLGLGVVLIRFKKKENLFLLFWFLTSLIPSLTGTPNGSHAIGSLPPVYIFAGIGLYTLYKMIYKSKIAKKNNIHYIFIFLILSSAAYTTFDLYLGPNRRELWGFYPETTVVGNYMKPRIKNADFYLTDNYPRDALTYLTYQGGDPWIKHYTWFEDGNSFLNAEKNPGKSLSFIMFPADFNRPLVNSLQKKYPQGVISTLDYIDDHINRPAAWVFQVN